MSNADDFRAMLPELVDDLTSAVTDGLRAIESAIETAPKTTPEQDAAWRKGMKDALKLMSYASEANDRLRREAAKAAPDVGVTEAERRGLLA